MENIYLINGIDDFQLRNLSDLLKIHGINVRTTEGFSELSEEDKKSYETFIIRYMNAHELSYRSTIYPKRIYRAFEIDYLIKEDPTDDYYLKFAGEVWNCNKKNNEFMVNEWGDIASKTKNDVIKQKKDSYLRVELKEGDTNSWLHITREGEEWY